MGIERRKSPRIRASLEIQVMDLERRAIMRRGDLSVTGVRVESLGVDVGQPGAEHVLRIATRDREERVEIRVRVVRVVRSFDIDTGAHVGATAFEFLPNTESERELLAMLFVHVARAQIHYDDDGVRPASEPPGLRGSEGKVRGVIVETDWQLRKGETIKIEVPSREGSAVRFVGRAVRSRASTKGTYRTLFELEREADSFVGMLPSDPSRHMTGDLSSIQVPSILSLAAMERMTGVLSVEYDGRLVTVYIRDGQVVDAVEPDSNGSRRKLIGDVCQWAGGRFELRLQDVDRADGIGVPTAVLLLQLARFYDEKRRVA